MLDGNDIHGSISTQRSPGTQGMMRRGDGRAILVGVISDTHGLLRPEVVEALEGSELIVHAGDIGDVSVLERLRAIAPTIAVRGNVDTSAWARTLPMTEVVEAGELQLYVLHDLATLDLDPKAAGFAAVISGHTHRPGAHLRDGVLFLNPGSAGPRRFTLPVAIARLQVAGSHLSHRIIELRL
jgi:putative phosphoesterase